MSKRKKTKISTENPILVFPILQVKIGIQTVRVYPINRKRPLTIRCNGSVK